MLRSRLPWPGDHALMLRNAGGVSETSLCQPATVAVSLYGDALFIGDSGNNRVLRFDAPFCVGDYELNPETRKLRGIRSTPKGTKVRVKNGFDPLTDDDQLYFSGRMVLLENDGGISGGDEPLLTLSTANGIVFQERVPYLRNVRVTNSGGKWDTDIKDLRDTGIDDFRVSTRFLIPANDNQPQRDNIRFKGRAVGLDLSGFTESEATFRLQFDSICFTTQLQCRTTSSGRICRRAR